MAALFLPDMPLDQIGALIHSAEGGGLSCSCRNGWLLVSGERGQIMAYIIAARIVHRIELGLTYRPLGDC